MNKLACVALVALVMASGAMAKPAHMYDTREVTDIDTDSCTIDLDGDTYSTDDCDSLGKFTRGEDVTVTTSGNGYQWADNGSDEIQISN